MFGIRGRKSVSLLTMIVAIACATTTATGDTMRQSINVDGTERDFLLHLPPTTRKTYPLVLVFHGGFGTPERIENKTGFDSIADREDFIVSYPRGLRRHWRDGRMEENFQGRGDDDVIFVKRLIAALERHYPIDPHRIYAVGLSNGGIFSYRLACELSDKIAAIASVSGSMGGAMPGHCHSVDPVSILHIYGTADSLVQQQGGPIAGGRMPGTVVSLNAVRKFWLRADHCNPASKSLTALPVLDPDDNTRVTLERYTECKGGSEIRFYRIAGGGHAWPGPEPDTRFLRRGPKSGNLDATQVIWDFFRHHQR